MSCNEEKNETQIHYNCQKCVSHNRQNNSTFMRCIAILTRINCRSCYKDDLQKTSFLCWFISRKENTSGLNSWYQKFVRQTIGLGAFIGNTSQIVSA